ncbi:hypothetical protein AMTR_s00058p00113130 [Amborella trichopoda]|uniref:Phytocyanin domain-containing protein n=1 Tax=Amborella trichopoda TaxID=13333 RepID=W1PFP9_AMBTC|nr:hypothetical protein AMTR_s00058p00113130 [Amborella trichopoda]
MEGIKKRFLLLLLVVALMAASSFSSLVSATLHKVGGNSFWNPGVNYTEWASHDRFIVGDYLCEFLSPRFLMNQVSLSSLFV